jgi:hypothetical protein
MRGPSLGKPGTLVVHILDAPSGKFLGASDERGDDFTKATGQRLRTRATYAPRRRVFGSRATTAPTTAARSLSNPVRLEVRFLIPDGSVPQARFAAFATLATLTLGVTPVGAQPHAGGPREDAGTAAAPDADAPHATLTCEHVPAPGRVRCEVEARVSSGDSISWGDVVIRSVPPFAAALRGRVGPHDASVREPGLWRWAFALVARGKGAGDVEGQVRVVVCRDKACAARDVQVVGKIEVGP